MPNNERKIAMTTLSKQVFVNGVLIKLANGNAYLFDYISEAGWIKITDIGTENLYFTFKSDCGKELPGYCKCL